MYDTFRNCKIYFGKSKKKNLEGRNNIFITNEISLNKEAPSGRKGPYPWLIEKWVNTLKQACHPSATHYSKTEQIAMPGTSIF